MSKLRNREAPLRILLVGESEARVADLSKALTEGGAEVITVPRRPGRSRLIGRDALVLDAVPGGLDRIASLRRGSRPLPLLVVTGPAVADKIRALDLGADDVVREPVEPDELLAHLRSLVRRARQAQNPVLHLHDLEIHVATRTVRRGEATIPLTPREFSLLLLLAQNCGRIVSRATMWNHLYSGPEPEDSNLLNVHMRSLRQKIDGDSDAPLIHTRRGKGYILLAEGD